MSSEWESFLALLAEISVALVALLFVSYQISREKWIKESSSSLRRQIAPQTALEFMVPFLFAISGMLPVDIDFGPLEYPWQVGAIFGCLMALLIAANVIQKGIGQKQRPLDDFSRSQLRLQWLVLLEYGIILYLSLTGNLQWVAVMMIWLLISGSYEAWIFFMELESDLR